MDLKDSNKTPPQRDIGKLGWTIHILCIGLIPSTVFQWCIHHSKDGLYFGILLFALTLVLIPSAFALLLSVRRGRTARKEQTLAT